MKKIFNKTVSKPTLFLYFFIPIITAIIRAIILDNDIWFLLNTGKYIVRHGFPVIEPFTLHSNLEFVVQQWLTDVSFYFAHLLLGGWGIFILTMLLFILILFISYKLCMLVSDGKVGLSVALSCIIGFLYSLFFVRSRPQMFDFILFLSMFYLLEAYIRKKNIKYLYFLPLLSLLLINLHASVWFMFYLFMLPYILGSFKIKFLCFEGDSYPCKPLIIISVLMFLAGFINPYGIGAISYIFTSYNNIYINKIVNEMMPPIINTIQGMMVYITIFLVLLAFLCNKDKPIKIRYFLLFLGTTYLSLCNLKSFSYFITASIFFFGDYLGDLFKEYEDNYYYYSKSFKRKYACCLLLFSIILLGVIRENYKDFDETALSPIMNYMENKLKVKKGSRVYTMYDDGGYVEYRGYRAYIDPRAEIFSKANNKKSDIIKEYYKLQHGQADYLTFLTKYDFDYLILYENDYLYKYFISTDKNTMYKKLYSSKYYESRRYLYEKIRK